MANKRIILLSDGTGNSAGKVWRTNVWRVFESHDLTSSQQIAFYDDGVGTSSFKPFAILGGAFGFGLKRNVLDIYKFACRNYRSHLDYLALEAAVAKAEGREERYGPWQSDDIFAFGFSRGAFTIRVVNGLICEQGLVKYQTEEELDRKVAAAYRAHRAETFKSRFQVEWVFRKLRNLFVSAKHDKNERPVDHIAFLGLWDTVAAYGLPIDEMTRGVSRYLWPLELPDRQLHPLVRKACHALSLDDERTTFHPLLWDESPETVVTDTRRTSSERITQVWFAGVHSNVGGGYPDDSLAHVSLTWMLSEARSRGLTLKAAPGADPDAFTRVRSTQDKDGRIYDSRNGLGGYYRYGPRSVAALSDTKFSDDKRDCVKIAIPKIHESVFDRISVDAHLYAPVALPPVYEILTYDERIVTPDKLTVPPGRPKYESLASARQRELTQEHVVGSSIWRRRIIYFLTVIASLYLLTYPLTSTAPAAAEFTTPLRPLSDLIRMVGLTLPGAASRWINAYAREPLWFVLCAGLVALLLWLSARLKDRITDQMRRAWRVSLAKVDLHRGESKPRLGLSTSQMVVLAGLLFVALYPLPGWTGYSLPKLSASPQTFIDRITHPYFQFFAFAVLVTMLLPDRTIAGFRLKDAYRRLLTNIKLKVAPAFFAVFFLVGGIAFASHYLFNIRDSLGHFCQPAEKPITLEVCDPDDMKLCKRAPDGSFHGTCTSAACRGVDLAAFNTADLCTPVGVMLERRGHYQFILEKDGDWSFLGAPSGPGGMPLRAFLPNWKKNGVTTDPTVPLGRFALLAAAYPLKRTLDRPFGHVILRYGETGNEENFIDGEPANGRLDEKFRATRDGQLFVYLNQPVSGVFPGLFRNVNSGKARVWVYRIPR
ncbi:DUF2235 domain-containing protein [Bradyrhizobium retamae]|uniref:T6SS Phospholipase effector Tle1-like catalytic domain-containing protein n=1 Tax=Bradyrhizobium retamae TaxID=1300035 RepID=A0A0R3MT00_9BRAD|nr:DUF2235 domain-containing protein [Bradyrhizobium retamae]KRR23209.1 hypothetical protein CQ13_27320 [Bradyrhizobium retamae]